MSTKEIGVVKVKRTKLVNCLIYSSYLFLLLTFVMLAWGGLNKEVYFWVKNVNDSSSSGALYCTLKWCGLYDLQYISAVEGVTTKVVFNTFGILVLIFYIFSFCLLVVSKFFGAKHKFSKNGKNVFINFEKLKKDYLLFAFSLITILMICFLTATPIDFIGDRHSPITTLQDNEISESISWLLIVTGSGQRIDDNTAQFLTKYTTGGWIMLSVTILVGIAFAFFAWKQVIGKLVKQLCEKIKNRENKH